jgi:hypothetical protein
MARIHISDGSTFPRPCLESDNAPLSWILTYGQPTREELLAAASIIQAYGYLLLNSDRAKRDLVCREVRSALRAEAGA